MSERITAANLDEVIKRNEVIEEQMKQSASLIWSKYNPMQINSPIQLALQILRPYGLIQLPIDNRYLSGAIFVRDGKRIPLINTALPRANQYFTAWHEISLVRPSYVVNVSPLQEKINKTIRNEPEVEYHKDNEAFLKTVLSEFKMLTGEADA